MLAGGGVIGIVALGQYYGADPLHWAGFRIVPPRVSVVDEVQRIDRSWSQRLYMWEQTLPLVRQRPVLGWGSSTLMSRFPGYGSAEYRRRFGEETVELIDNPLNELLSVVYSMGLVGLVAYLWVWTVSVSGVGRGARQATEASHPDAALLAALAAYFIWMQSAWSHLGVANVFWVLLGLAAATHDDRPTSKSL